MSRKRLNAVKHGAFATTAILPGEDGGEFDLISQDLLVEWRPSGFTEHYYVASLAKAIWRKRRLEQYWCHVMVERVLEARGSVDEGLKLLSATAQGLREARTDQAIDVLLSNLSADDVQLIQSRTQPGKESDPAGRGRQLAENIEGLVAGVEQILDMRQFSDPDELQQQMQANERAEAEIERTIKRLAQAKWTKRTLGLE
jgi:hypothetical protein